MNVLPMKLKPNSLYVSSPVNALVLGILREDKTLEQILTHGNFGLGTFNDLDGEMVLLDGSFYQIRSDGSVSVAPLEGSSPYACVTEFGASQKISFQGPVSYADLQKSIDELILSKNLIYAVRVTGKFSFVRARSVPKQHAYRPLVEVAGDQKEFIFEDISGVLAGFWTPNFMQSISVPGYHLHFLSLDRMHGGHLLDCSIQEFSIEFQAIDQLILDMPHSIEYLSANLDKDVSGDLQKAEH
ncbi:acetolactate decarboxylase [Polynucleobacter meluiroseus]|uniref:Alpha-acetolactate decarboxylase n=1 Tax=Polynucleobacter meluiroseus TaxID=1938814 RepID=A0A240E1I4_9BURK|nr:acetolactate decarboxylase [Polynucleobacter meluiroseus]SNX28720.1 acetolactate decarboxylase [Polynucleobacter meluiroseus]